jgi:hypothetical protein
LQANFLAVSFGKEYWWGQCTSFSVKEILPKFRHNKTKCLNNVTKSLFGAINTNQEHKPNATNSLPNSGTEQVGPEVSLWAYVLKVLGSNLDRDADLPVFVPQTGLGLVIGITEHL